RCRRRAGGRHRRRPRDGGARGAGHPGARAGRRPRPRRAGPVARRAAGAGRV
ncbi:MAG: hypothetical protein AVDCRST_MAG48-3739, partial [uncultured Friedmanniella sp.]